MKYPRDRILFKNTSVFPASLSLASTHKPAPHPISESHQCHGSSSKIFPIVEPIISQSNGYVRQSWNEISRNRTTLKMYISTMLESSISCTRGPGAPRREKNGLNSFTIVTSNAIKCVSSNKLVRERAKSDVTLNARRFRTTAAACGCRRSSKSTVALYALEQYHFHFQLAVAIIAPRSTSVIILVVFLISGASVNNFLEKFSASKGQFECPHCHYSGCLPSIPSSSTVSST